MRITRTACTNYAGRLTLYNPYGETNGQKLFREQFEKQLILKSSYVIKHAINATNMITVMKNQLQTTISRIQQG
jgi:hypothetical protein